MKSYYVYFIKCGEYIKIGIAQDVKNRIAILQTANFKKLEFCGSAYFNTFNEALHCEQALHKYYWNTQIRGEWFHLQSFEYYYDDVRTIVDSHNGGATSLDWIIKDL